LVPPEDRLTLASGHILLVGGDVAIPTSFPKRARRSRFDYIIVQVFKAATAVVSFCAGLDDRFATAVPACVHCWRLKRAYVHVNECDEEYSGNDS
jgi:hypothetical protein